VVTFVDITARKQAEEIHGPPSGSRSSQPRQNANF